MTGSTDDQSADATEQTAEPETADTRPAARRNPNAAAAAASRARRIGGRPAAASAEPAVGAPAGTDTAHDEPRRPVALGKKRGAAPRDAVPAAPASPRGRGGAVWLPATVLTAVALALAIVLAIALAGGKPSADAARDRVLAAAKTCVVAANSYSYKNLAAFEKKGLACGTGDFQVKFAQSVDKVIKKIAPTIQQVQTLQVNTAGIIDVTSGDRWDVLIYGQIHVVNKSYTGDGRTDPFGATVTMVHKNGRWLISDQEALCTQYLQQTGNKCV